MSSMRNAVQRRNHKERAQPLEREKWGVLEKHKDYTLRAKDYSEKKKRLKILRQKAAERNPDEFHFAMMSSKTDQAGRKLMDRGNKSLNVDTVKLLKTQDAGYLRTMAQKTRKLRRKLEQEIVLGNELRGGQSDANLEETRRLGQGTHVVFVSKKEEHKKYDHAISTSRPIQSLERGSKTLILPNGEPLGEEGEGKPEEIARLLKPTAPKDRGLSSILADRLLRKRRRRRQEARKSRLAALKNREKELTAAEQELEMQRAKMNDSVGGVTKAGHKWKVPARKR